VSIFNCLMRLIIRSKRTRIQTLMKLLINQKNILAIIFLVFFGTGIHLPSPALCEIKFSKLAPSRNSLYVSELYKALLGRPANYSELVPAVKVLDTNGSKSSLADSVIASVEFRTTEVKELYKSLLGRDVDQGALETFLAVLNSGGSIKDIRSAILSSDEFFDANGGAVRHFDEYLTKVFNDLLGRTPTTAEISELTRILIGGVAPTPRSTIINTILSSDERKIYLINGYYNKYLGRAASTVESNFLIGLLRNLSEEQFLAFIVGSDEYFLLKSPGSFKGSESRVYLGSFTFSGEGLTLDMIKVKIRWGDGKTTDGEIVDAGGGEYAVFGSHLYKAGRKFHVTVILSGGKDSTTARLPLLARKDLTSINPFPNFKGGVSVAVGDVNGDGAADIVAGTGPGAAQVKVFSGLDGTLLRNFSPYATFTGGVFVATGDINGDGKADIITGVGSGASPHVKVFSGADSSELASFFAYDSAFTGGVRVAAGDVNGDGLADIITGAGASAASHVKVFDGSNFSELRSFFAYDSAFTGGVFVAAGDVNGDGTPDIITGAGAGAGPHVKVFNGKDNSELASFFAYASSFTGGVRVAAGDLNADGKADIITGPEGSSASHVKVFDGVQFSEIRSFFGFDPTFKGGIYVAAGDLDSNGKSKIVLGSGAGKIAQIKIN
jgi:hypothetical protein